MKKKIWFVLALTLSGFLFMSFSPSLDGRAVVADEGVLPQGIFAKTVGYLPGDSISVTNLVDKTTVDILVIGALDPSEGVAILLSPEAAKLLGIEKKSNNVVKITKRSGQLDEIVAGTALIGQSQAPQEEEKSDNANEEEPLVPPAEEIEESKEVENPSEVTESAESTEETLPVSEEENTITETEDIVIEEKPLSVPLEESSEDAESEKIAEELPVSEEPLTEEVTEESVENPLEKEVSEEAVSENIQIETPETEENIPSEKIEEKNVSEFNDSDLSEAVNEEELSENNEPLEKLDTEELSPLNEESLESEKVSEILSEPVSSENSEEKSDSTELTEEKVSEDLNQDENLEINIEETEENVPVSGEIEKIVEEKEEEISSDSEKITDELDFSNTHIDTLKAEKVEEEIPLPQEEIRSEKISDDGELYSEKEKNVSEPEEEKILANGDTLIESEAKRKAEEPVASERIYPEVIDEKYLEGPEKDVSTVPFVEDEVPQNYDKYLEELKKQKDKEEIFVSENNPVEEKIPVSEPEKEAVRSESENIPSEESENLLAENTEVNSSVKESSETESEPEEKSETECSSEESYEAIVLVPAENNPPSQEKEELSNNVLSGENNIVENAKTETVSDKTAEVKMSEVKESEIEVKSEAQKVPYDFSSFTLESLKSLESGKYYIQIAVLSDENNIKSIFDKYYGKYPIVLVPLKSGAAKQVLIGPLSVDEYGTVLQRFKSYGYKDAFLRKIK